MQFYPFLLFWLHPTERTGVPVLDWHSQLGPFRRYHWARIPAGIWAAAALPSLFLALFRLYLPHIIPGAQRSTIWIRSHLYLNFCLLFDCCFKASWWFMPFINFKISMIAKKKICLLWSRSFWSILSIFTWPSAVQRKKRRKTSRSSRRKKACTKPRWRPKPIKSTRRPSVFISFCPLAGTLLSIRSPFKSSLMGKLRFTSKSSLKLTRKCFWWKRSTKIF